ncbi:MAG: carbamoyltransferase HypF [Acidimicrobiales bacterium]
MLAFSRARIRVTGTVQGVGFRPFVYRNAVARALRGFVRNDSLGVLIEVEGPSAQVAELVRVVGDDPPPLARVDDVVTEHLEVLGLSDGFQIIQSVRVGEPTAAVSIDSATCRDCLAEVDDPSDRRYRYPFINCTNCGPRYTIVRAVPYDRPLTTMAGFTMCAACQREYEDPGDRRFHAQPNACPECGPHLAWRDPAGNELAAADDALIAAADAIRSGQVVAVKGIGGFHLAVDATSADAVAELRHRKHRDDKPFAVMPRDLADAEALCVLDDRARAALESPRRPIVLAPRRANAAIAPAVAPAVPELGLLLPYSALHHLLMRAVDRPIVLTSGNVSDEPIAHIDADAVGRLGPLVDGLLTHDRPIHIRCDDSVVRAAGGRPTVLRRSRGYAPEPVALPFEAPGHVLAVGAELKSTVSVARGRSVVVSHHLGDLEHLATYQAFLQAVDHLPALTGVRPALIAHDLHPEYLSSKYAADSGLETFAVQHHHAHVAACMVEHGRTEPVLGVAFDGLGFGADGTLWGGELLVADLGGFERVGHLRTVPMPGGAAAIRQPWRMAAVWAERALGREQAIKAIPGVDASRIDAVLDVATAPSTPVTSSMGRLFDAVAALLGCRNEVTYEAQAAIELEALARTVPASDAPCYDEAVEWALEGGIAVIDPAPLVARVIVQRDDGIEPARIAAGFHAAIGRVMARIAAELAAQHGLDTVVLSGGVFQNVRMRTTMKSALEQAGTTVLAHEKLPTNDGSISVGQAAVAAWSTR